MVMPGVELRRKRTQTGNGAVLARAGGELELAFLAKATYADGSPVQEGDVIGAAGKNSASSTARCARAAGADNVTTATRSRSTGGSGCSTGSGTSTTTTGCGSAPGRTGVWEMVQFRMDDEAGHPDIAGTAQHSYGELRPWERA